MTRRGFLASAVGTAATLALHSTARAARREATRKPNIVLILADDMGYSDLACYGSEIATPNLDRLAASGLRFRHFYNTARCCPTRASLLTGLYPHQAGIGMFVGDRWRVGTGGYRGDLSPNTVTIAEALKPGGYRAYCSGKWHVTINPSDFEGPKDTWPRQRGFDRFYGTLTGANSYWDPATLARDNEPITRESDPHYKPDTYYYTDAISDNAAAFIHDHVRGHRESPFFLYVAYTAPHWPMHAPEEEIARYHGVYDAGYDATRRRRFARMKQLGAVEPNCALSPTFGDWDQVEDKAWEARCMETYAAMVTRMDKGIGSVLAALEDEGLRENTLVVFLSDNGGCAEETGRKKPVGPRERPPEPTFPPKPAEWRPQPVCEQTRDGYPVRRGPGVMPGPEDTHMAYGEGWANVSNTPYRYYKKDTFEGGIRTPLIVNWPEGIGSPDAWVDAPGHCMDILATCIDVAGVAYPDVYEGREVTPLEGTSLAPLFHGGSLPERALLFEHQGNAALREGKWKIAARNVMAPDDVRIERWELHDLEVDPAELNDLAAEHPDIVQRLSKRFTREAERVLMLPSPWGK